MINDFYPSSLNKVDFRATSNMLKRYNKVHVFEYSRSLFDMTRIAPNAYICHMDISYPN